MLIKILFQINLQIRRNVRVSEFSDGLHERKISRNRPEHNNAEREPRTFIKRNQRRLIISPYHRCINGRIKPLYAMRTIAMVCSTLD